MAIHALADVMREWLEVRFGGQWPVASDAPAAPDPEPAPPRQLQLPLRLERPDEGVYHPEFLATLRVRRPGERLRPRHRTSPRGPWG
jgi:hypothetical protein